MRVTGGGGRPVEGKIRSFDIRRNGKPWRVMIRISGMCRGHVCVADPGPSRLSVGSPSWVSSVVSLVSAWVQWAVFQTFEDP